MQQFASVLAIGAVALIAILVSGPLSAAVGADSPPVGEDSPPRENPLACSLTVALDGPSVVVSPMWRFDDDAPTVQVRRDGAWRGTIDLADGVGSLVDVSEWGATHDYELRYRYRGQRVDTSCEPITVAPSGGSCLANVVDDRVEITVTREGIADAVTDVHLRRNDAWLASRSFAPTVTVVDTDVAPGETHEYSARYRLAGQLVEIDCGVVELVDPGFGFRPFDVIIDHDRSLAYLTKRSGRRGGSLWVIDLETGDAEQIVRFDHLAERMAMSPDGDRLYVGLPVQDHACCWDEDDQYGYVARIELGGTLEPVVFEVAIDPWDIAVDDNDRLVISSGSGQWVDTISVDGLTGAELGRLSSVRHQSELAMHPSGRFVYAADTDSSPSDIERYDLGADGTLTDFRDSRYHGDHRMDGDVWIAPSGHYLVTRGGDIFTAGQDGGADMVYVASLATTAVNDVLFDEEAGLIILGDADSVKWFDIAAFNLVGEQRIGSPVRYVGLDAEAIVFIADADPVRFDRIPRPDSQPRCASRQVGRVVELTITRGSLDRVPSSVHVRRNGSWLASSSFEPALTFTDETVEWDETYEYSARYRAGGEVVDIACGTITHTLTFQPFDVVADPVRPLLYLTDRGHRALHVYDLDAREIVRSINFDHFAERVAITPDGETLYVALPSRPHSPFRWEESQFGYFARVDLSDYTVTVFETPNLDPWDIVATNDGRVMISSGSGQWTDAASYDGSSGAELDRTSIRQQTLLTLHPSQRIVYGATTDTSPADIERYDFAADGSLVNRGDSPYHGQHRMGTVWVAPTGDHLITAGGDVFTAGGAGDTDMIFVREVLAHGADAVAFDRASQLLFSAKGRQVAWYDSVSYELIGQHTTERPVREISVGADEITFASNVGNSPFETIAKPARSTTCTTDQVGDSVVVTATWGGDDIPPTTVHVRRDGRWIGSSQFELVTTLTDRDVVPGEGHDYSIRYRTDGDVFDVDCGRVEVV